MRSTWLAIATLLLWPGLAAAVDCADWRRMTPEQKDAKVAAMIESHLNSNVSKRYTSENLVAMRRCLQDFAPEIRDQFDGACAQGSAASLGALDEIFDRHLLSCVQ